MKDLEKKNTKREKYPFLKESDKLQLSKAIKKIKQIPDVLGIVQIGSSTYSQDYNDIDIIVFFDRLLIPPELEAVRKIIGKKAKIWIEGVSIYYKGFNPGSNVFIKFFSNLKHKKVLYGKNPFTKKRIPLKKTEVAAYIWYHYHICEQYGTGYENALPNSMNAMLAYIDIFPENKEQTFKIFLKQFRMLAKHLPKNSHIFLRGTTKANFKELYPFFEQCLEYFTK